MRDPEVLRQVKNTLAQLAQIAPGNSVEVRIPPYGAIQCVAGPRHTRGTPANVIEMSAPTWLALARGDLLWESAMSEGLISASGTRADISEFLPLPTDKSEVNRIAP